MRESLLPLTSLLRSNRNAGPVGLAQAMCLVLWVLLLSILSVAHADAKVSTERYELHLYAHSHLLLDSEMQCIDKLYDRESHWNPKAINPHSGAYGIPQGMSTWLRTATPRQQILWGIKYAMNRYGSMCGAYRHWQLKGWH
jgi:hypothetical protein